MTDTTERDTTGPEGHGGDPGGEGLGPRGEIAGGAWRLGLVIAATLAVGLLGGWPVLIVVLAVAVMIFLHELGHFLTAKWSGMKVTEFFIGFGPKIWSFRRGETEYGLKVIPAGAYVRIVGMHNLEEVPVGDEARTYRQQSFPRRLSVAVAGSTMHFLQALVLVFLLLVLSPVPGGTLFILDASDVEAWHVREVTGGSAADEAGLLADDEVVAIDDTAIGDFGDLSEYVLPRAGEEVVVTVERDGRTLELPTTLGSQESDPSRGFLGVGLALDRVEYSTLEAIPRSGGELLRGVELSSLALADFFTPDSLGNFFGKVTDEGEPATGSAPAAEPSGGGGSAGDEAEEDRLISIYGAVRLGADLTSVGWEGLAMFLVQINVFVGIFNLIPLLPFDGGHVAIAVYERARSRRDRRHFADVTKLLPLTYAVVMFVVLIGVTSLYLDIVDPVSL